jgi:hypothetical protein
MASIPNVGTRTGPPVVTDRYVDFSDIVGGALVATAISLILFAFGSAFGLSFTSAEPGEGVSLRWVAIGGGLWLIWTAVISGAAGGYFAGRMRKPVGDADADEIETRDGAHGIAVWAVATLITALLSATGVGGTIKAVGPVLGDAAESVATVIGENADYLAGVALRSDAGLSSPQARAEVARVLVRGLGEKEVSESDRVYLAQVVATESRIPAGEARTRIDQVITDAEKARDAAVEAAEQARVFALIGAFVVAASMLASAAAAYFAAVLGGQHRNGNVGFARFMTAPRKRS